MNRWWIFGIVPLIKCVFLFFYFFFLVTVALGSIARAATSTTDPANSGSSATNSSSPAANSGCSTATRSYCSMPMSGNSLCLRINWCRSKPGHQRCTAATPTTTNRSHFICCFIGRDSTIKSVCLFSSHVFWCRSLDSTICRCYTTMIYWRMDENYLQLHVYENFHCSSTTVSLPFNSNSVWCLLCVQPLQIWFLLPFSLRFK